MANADWQDNLVAEIKAYGGTFVRKSGRNHAIYRLGTENVVLHTIGASGCDPRHKANETALLRKIIVRQLSAGNIVRRKGPSTFLSDTIGLTTEEIDRMNASSSDNGTAPEITATAAAEEAPAVERYPCGVAGCDFVGQHPQGLGRHRSAAAGKNGHPAYENKVRARPAEKAAATPPSTSKLLRVTPTGRVRELVDLITASLAELAEVVEGQAVELKTVRDERNDLRGIVDKIEQTQAVILGRRKP